MGGDLARPGAEGPDTERHRQRDQQGHRAGHAVVVDQDVLDDRAQQHGLGDQGQGADESDGHRPDQVVAGGGGPPDQPGVDRPPCRGVGRGLGRAQRVPPSPVGAAAGSVAAVSAEDGAATAVPPPVPPSPPVGSTAPTAGRRTRARNTQ